MSPSIALSSDDFPDPTSPMTQTNSALRISRLRPFSCTLSSELASLMGFTWSGCKTVSVWSKHSLSVLLMLKTALGGLLACLVSSGSLATAVWAVRSESVLALASLLSPSLACRLPPHEKLAFSMRMCTSVCWSSLESYSTKFWFISGHKRNFWIRLIDTMNDINIPRKLGIHAIGSCRRSNIWKHAKPVPRLIVFPSRK
mmetsp:Transcript_41880/g.48426  ORF Transcript_41880/g.48426 Transcript_41880/m.48426 type:complete len:200 (-) Transcript_41880:657-1256(-)